MPSPVEPSIFKPPSTVPILKFVVQKLPKAQGLKLIFTHTEFKASKANKENNEDKESKDRKESSVTFEQILSFDGSISTNSQASSFYSISRGSNLDVITLSCVGMEGLIEITREGNLILGPFINHHSKLALQTEGQIKVDSPVDVYALHCQAKDMIVLQPIQTQTRLTLDIKDTLENHSILQSMRSVVIYNRKRLVNVGLISAETKLSMIVRNLQNSGCIIAQVLDIELSHRKTKLAKAKNIQKKVEQEQKALQLLSFNNRGQLFGVKALKITANSAHLINQGTGEMLSQKRFNLIAARFTNFGKVVAPLSMAINTYQIFSNDVSGFIQTQSLCVELGTDFNNLGKIEAQQQFSILAHTFHNIGHLKGNNLFFQGKTNLENQGLIEGLSEVRLGSDGPIFNAANAKILSNKTIAILGLGRLNNAGEMTGLLSITTQTLGKTHNEVLGKIQAEFVTVETIKEPLINAGKTAAAKQLIVRAPEVYNVGQGTLTSKGLFDVTSEKLINDSKIEAENIRVFAGSLFNAVLKGEIIAKDTILLDLRSQLESAHLIRAKNKIEIRAQTLVNLKFGQIETLGQAKLEVEDLKNLGDIEADKLFLETSLRFSNSPYARLAAKRVLELITRCEASNRGKLTSQGLLLLRSTRIFVNELGGVIKSKEQLKISSMCSLENAGRIFSKGDVLIEVLHRFSNLVEGWIQGKNTLVQAEQITNACKVEAREAVTVNAKTLLENQSTGTILSGVNTQLFSENILENKGAAESLGSVALDSNNLLLNRSSGTVHAGSDLSLTAKLLHNQGSCQSQENFKVKADMNHNDESGTLNAGKKLQVHSRYLFNHGKISSLKALSLKIEELCIHAAGGKLAAKETVEILAQNLHLAGHLIAEKQFSIQAEEQFNYNTETLWVVGILKLILKKGYRFVKPINTLGDLQIISDASIAVETKLQADNLSVKASTISVAQGLFAKNRLEVDSQHLQVNAAAYLASNGNLGIKSHTAHNQGSIYTLGNLLTQALMCLENSGNITVAGNAQIKAPLFNQKILTESLGNYCRAISQKPRMTVAKDCEIEGSLDMLGAELQVGGTLRHQGNFYARSFESYRTWTETHRVKGSPRGLFGIGAWVNDYHYTVQYIPRKETFAIYDSRISAGRAVDIRNAKQFILEGCLSSPSLHISFQKFHNGNRLQTSAFQTSASPQFQVFLNLDQFFRENALFTQNQAGSPYRYGPQVPLKSSGIVLAPAVQLDNLDPGNTDTPYHPFIEQDLLQQGIQSNHRRGHLEKIDPIPAVALTQLRQNAYQFLVGQGKKYLTETDCLRAQMPMLVYRNGSPILYTPEFMQGKIATGKSHQAMIFAQNACFQGAENSTLLNEGTIQVEQHLELFVGEFTNQQKTREEYQKMQVNRRSSAYVAVQKPEEDTGIIRAGRITGHFNRFSQIGGHIHSGSEGTYLEIRDSALFQALRITEAQQGKVTRAGKNYQIEPVFIPVKITSLGDQTIIVTQGGLLAEGIYSEAVNNTIKTAQDIYIRHKEEAFELASTSSQSGFLGLNQRTTGGSSFSALSSKIIGDSLDLNSSQGSITLINSLLYSGGDTTLKAKKLISILNANARTSMVGTQAEFRGFGYQERSVSQQQSHVLRSQIFVGGNLSLTAEQARLKAIEGYIGKNMTVEALTVALEGAMEEQEFRARTQSFAVNFFGSQAIESLMQGANGRKALEHLLANDSFLSAVKCLSETKDTGEKITQSVQTLCEGWRLATLIARACDQPQNLLGSLTDRYGITTPIRDSNGQTIGHQLNPNFSFRFSVGIEKQSQNRVISSTLMIGGDLHIVADVLQLKDGTKIQAENIKLKVKKLLEIKAGRETQKTSFEQNSASLNITAGGTITGGSFHHQSDRNTKIRYENTCLRARNLLSILSEKTSIQGGELLGKEVLIKTNELLLESLQDREQASSISGSVSISQSGGSILGASIQSGYRSLESSWVNNPSFIQAERNLDLFVDYLCQKGSILNAETKIRIQGLTAQKPMRWEAHDIYNVERGQNHTINLGITSPEDSFPIMGSVNTRKIEKRGVSRVTVGGPLEFAANDLGAKEKQETESREKHNSEKENREKKKQDKNNQEKIRTEHRPKRNSEGSYMPAHINRDLSQAQTILFDSRTSLGVPILVPNGAKLAQDWSAIAIKSKSRKF